MTTGMVRYQVIEILLFFAIGCVIGSVIAHFFMQRVVIPWLDRRYRS